MNGPDAACMNSISSYRTTTQAGITSLWSVTGGAITGSANRDTVFVNWGSGNQGTIKLTQTRINGGCMDSIVSTVTLNATPTPDFTGVLAVCPNSTHTYTAVGPGFWKATGGVIIGDSTLQHVTVQWAAGAGRALQFSKVNSSGCRDSVLKAIQFKSNLSAIIKGEASACHSSITTFSAQTITGATYLWTVTGGKIIGSSTSPSINVEWNNGTKGFIRLIQTDAVTLCADTNSREITLQSPPVVSISGDFINITNGVTTQYSAPANPGGTNVWSVQGGIITSGTSGQFVSVLWNATGSASLKLIQTNASGCRDSIIHQLEVKAPSTVMISGPAVVCENTEGHSYTIPLQAGMTVQWKVMRGTITMQSGNTAEVQWLAFGNGELQAIRTITETGFKDTSVFYVTVQPQPLKPVINQISGKLTSNAENGNQWFKNGAIIPGAQQQTYIPTESGIYAVQVTNTHSCMSPISEAIEFIYVSVENIPARHPQIVVTPNPANGYITIECPVMGLENTIITLTDLSGREVLKTEMASDEQFLKGSLDIQSVPIGTYFLHVRTRANSYTIKLSVQR